MGQPLTAWQNKVALLIRDAANKDLPAPEILTVGIRPAIAQYTIDRPRLVTVELAGAGSAYLDLPAGWLSGFSRLDAVEHPARQNPPLLLDGRSYRVVRDPSDVSVEQILLDRSVATGEYTRLTFTAPWPVPTSDAADDPIDSVAFEAVTALAASFCETSLASEAARSRSGALPTDFTDGRERARNLSDAAKTHRAVYNAFLGIVTDFEGDLEPSVSVNDFASLRYSRYDGVLLGDTWPRL